MFHEEGRAEDDQKRGCRQHLAGPARRQEPEERVQAVAAYDVYDRQGSYRLGGADQRLEAELRLRGMASGGEDRQQRQDWRNREVLEEKDGERALPVGRLEVAA